MSTEDLETLQFELESILYTKSEVELNEFAAPIKLDEEISTKSKITILKTIQKDIDGRVNTEGEMSERVAWFKDCIAKIKSHDQSQKVDKANELISLQQEIETLKEKQQSDHHPFIWSLNLMGTGALVVINRPSTPLPNLTTTLSHTSNIFLPVWQDVPFSQRLILFVRITRFTSPLRMSPKQLLSLHLNVRIFDCTNSAICHSVSETLPSHSNV
jgi:hypothetical protein